MLPVVLGEILGLGAPEILLILVIVLVLFGGAKLPQLARNLGRAKAEFQKGTKELPTPESEDEKTLRVARELGISTEGRSLGEVRAEIRQKMA